MLVDDNMDVRMVIAMGLEHLGYDVIECVDGREALRRCDEETPDVAIIDQGLPDIRGIEVGQQILQANQRPLVVALLTGSDGPELRQQAKTAGFDGFLVKPIRIQSLAEWIEARIEDRQN